MAVICPYCSKTIRPKQLRPGRFTPRCPKCGRAFSLMVPDSGSGMLVAPLRDGGSPGPLSPPAPAVEVPPVLGGYEILRPLGQGGMGTVYLARQVSLNREVALKVMHRDWVKDPRFLARFTREAHAAARLAHHNIVQIYDIDQDQGVHFFSMELVRGRTLADVLRVQGKADVATAVEYILQAARGLYFAHSHGLVHRDIKPDNLMVNEQGIVKVADLGLVKTPALAPADDADEFETGPSRADIDLPRAAPDVTRIGVGMGTPTYMAPEQARNAAAVDARADQYSLACTLYMLLTGRPPFQGETAMDTMLKHINEPVLPPHRLALEVPLALSAIVVKMLAKDPNDRFVDLGAVIAELERFLQGRKQIAKPTEEEAALLLRCATQFNQTPGLRLRGQIAASYLGLCVVLTLATLFLGWFGLASGFATLAVWAPLTVFVLDGLAFRTSLFVKSGQFLRGIGCAGWLILLAGMGALGAALWLLGLLEIWGAFFLVGLALGTVFHVGVERPLASERRKVLGRAEALLQRLRVRGLGEKEVRTFACQSAGWQWEEFFESLFGYDALRQARERFKTDATGMPRAPHLTWRDGVIAWMEARARDRREGRDDGRWPPGGGQGSPSAPAGPFPPRGADAPSPVSPAAGPGPQPSTDLSPPRMEVVCPALGFLW